MPYVSSNRRLIGCMNKERGKNKKAKDIQKKDSSRLYVRVLTICNQRVGGCVTISFGLYKL
jgi:hypothetical protein